MIAIVRRWLRAAMLAAGVALLPTISTAQEPIRPPPPQPYAALRFQHITNDDGLPNSRVEALAQDAHGFLWFGTADGLARYDGYELRTFRNDPTNPATLSANAISALLSDRSGTLWVGTREGGLNRLDPQTQQFHSYRYDPANPEGMARGGVGALAQAADGAIWLGVGRQLARLDPATGQFRHYQLPMCGNSQAVRKLAIAADGTLWLASGGLLAFDPATGTATCHPAPATTNRPAPELNDLALAATGELWLVGGSALYQFMPANGRWQAFALPGQQPAAGALPSAPAALAVQIDTNGLIWLGTVIHGLLVFDPANNQFLASYRSDATNPDSLASAAINRLYLSREGRLWLGTGGGGVSMLDLWQTRFTSYRAGRNSDLGQGTPGQQRIVGSGLLERPIRALAQGPDGVIWLGAAHYLTRFDPSTGSYTHFNPLRGVRPAGDAAAVDVNAIIPDGATGLWFDGVDGLSYFDLATERFSTYRPPAHNGAFIIWAMAADQQGHLWLTALGQQQIYRFDRQQRTFRAFALPAPATGAPAELRALAVDATGAVWVGARGSLYLLNQATGTITVERHNPTGPTALPDSQIQMIQATRDGSLWLATDSGLAHRAPGSHAWSLLTERQHLPTNLVRGVLEDYHGQIWLSSTGGLARLNPQTGALEFYTRADGLPGNEFSSGAVARGSHGSLLFAGNAGLTIIRPGQPVQRPTTTPVILTDLLLFNQPEQPGAGKLLERPIWETSAVTLDYHQSVVAFSFAAPFSATPRRQFYRYQLEGFEQHWNVVGANRRIATYTSLPPGNYTLRVQNSSDGNQWSSDGVTLQLVVLPPWWETWWFRLLAFVLVITLAALLVWLRVRGIEQQKRQLEAQVAARTSDLQAEIRERKHAEAALHKAYQELERLAVFDELTRVANRRRFDQYLHAAWQTRQTDGLCLLLCDVDQFKRYNDGYGHQAGDRCLYQVAQAIAAGASRTGDLVARYGGEEFAVILPNTDLAGALAVAEQIRRQLAHLRLPHRFANRSYVTLSIGVACASTGAYATSAQLIAAADEALYQAKHTGRDRVVAAAGREVAV